VTMKCACPGCKKVLDTKPEHAGKAVRCPSCKKIFKLPSTPAGPKTSESPKLESCPLCSANWTAGALACGDCGFLPTQSPPQAAAQTIACINNHCGFQNESGRKNCSKCGHPLPCAPGTLLQERFQIDGLMALGGFGAVYKGTDLSTGKTIAIKEMLCADKAQFNLRLNFFRREAEILRALVEQPIVPNLLGFIEQDQAAYIVMEYIQGKDLLKVLESTNNKPFSVSEVADWGFAICGVIDSMHRHDPPLVHRDIKPDNLMLMDDRSGIRMIDFGTARDLGPSGPDGQKAKTRIFTEGYAPPEQVVGRPEIRSDLFALAGTLFHLATGGSPEGTSTGREIGNRLDGKTSPPYDESERWFWEMIRINLSEDPSDRYYSAREFATDLFNRKVSTETACPSCSSTNPVRTPYCSSCASELTDLGNACPDCGKPSRMGCRYCIDCGGRIR